MDKVYNHKQTEEKWYKFWEESGFFKPEINPDGKPYTIILPPPNANASLHFGHAMFTVEDILIRYHRMKGEAALWLPGEDHAGTETQFVFEQHLAKMGKSRFDFDRQTLYQMIWDFVQENRGNIRIQMKRMGFSLDWDRLKYTLDPDIVKIVYKTFKKMFDEGLAYRANRLVNYCTKDGTSFSDLEVVYEDRKDKLYFIKFPIKDGGFVTIATTRPETMLGDVAVCVNPKDKRYKDIVGKQAILPITNRVVPIVADPFVDMGFGTGAVKITPSHDPDDFEVAKRNNLTFPPVVGFDGKMTKDAGKYSGMKILEARAAIIEVLQNEGLIEKIEDYIHRVGTCYKCGTVIEPLPLEQWFIKMEGLAKKAIDVVGSERTSTARSRSSRTIKIYPKNWESTYFNWLKNIKDWNISRQVVWGIQIPAWRCLDCNEWTVTAGVTPQGCDKCDKCGSENLEQDPDVFDTWFSSGQWPFATLQTTNPPAGGGDFEKFYPTSVMETMYDILLFWVARMIMLGIYSTGKIPFKDIVLHGKVLDPLGKKMSKSKGNVVNPMEIVDLYGADAARMALVYGTAFGHDQSLSHPKLQAMRNFTNKLWNIGRFIIDFAPDTTKYPQQSSNLTIEQLTHLDDQAIIKKLNQTIKRVSQALDQYRFHDGAESLYEFIWHKFADKYIESTKDRRAQAQPVLEYVFKTSLELLHPFMPYVTEELWQKLPHKGESIMLASWPSAS